MGKFTKKPVTIEAIQWKQTNVQEIENFAGDAAKFETKVSDNDAGSSSSCTVLTIHTLEGDMRADFGDYIIKGVKGEFYPCKPDIFEQTYMKAEDEVKGMTFGAAIDALKQGKFVARKGWNGKGMYLWLMPATSVKAEWCKEPHLKALAEQNGGAIDALGSIRMLTADKKILTGWLASQTDILSEDWVIVNPTE
jgi:hypothetical protein